MRIFKLTIRLLIISVVALLCSCASKPVQQPYAYIPALNSTQANPPSGVSNIRRQAIQDTALSLGAQAGLAWRSKQIDSMLANEQVYLSKVFDFNALILKNNVLPPVLVEGGNTLNLASPDALRLADKVYKIQLPPRFVTTPPSWRDYLQLNFNPPNPPSSTLLPKNEGERQLWNQYIKDGWNAGVTQANEIFSINLGRLKRDYSGMVLYRELLAQNMVTAPYVAKVDLGVTGDSNMMRVNDQVLRITATSKLNTNAKTWKAVITPGEAGGEDQDADQAAP